MRKLRAPSKLMQLPQAQQDALFKWLEVAGLTYPQAVEKLFATFGVRSDRSSLCIFRQQVIQRRLMQPAPAVAACAPAAILEIIMDVSRPGIVRLKFIPGVGVRLEGGSAL